MTKPAASSSLMESGTSKIVPTPIATGARLPKGWMQVATTRLPSRWRLCAGASITTPTPSWPDV